MYIYIYICVCVCVGRPRNPAEHGALLLLVYTYESVALPDKNADEALNTNEDKGESMKIKFSHAPRNADTWSIHAAIEQCSKSLYHSTIIVEWYTDFEHCSIGWFIGIPRSWIIIIPNAWRVGYHPRTNHHARSHKCTLESMKLNCTCPRSQKSPRLNWPSLQQAPQTPAPQQLIHQLVICYIAEIAGWKPDMYFVEIRWFTRDFSLHPSMTGGSHNM